VVPPDEKMFTEGTGGRACGVGSLAAGGTAG
jgi:hypothetical protein